MDTNDYRLRREPEPTEWQIAYQYDADKDHLPRVLLMGDSICNGYQDTVRRALAGSLFLSFWASSRCVTDPRFPQELAYQLDLAGTPLLIAFNNGLHSKLTRVEDYAAGLRDALDQVQQTCPEALLVLLTSTRTQDPEHNAHTEVLNQIVAEEGTARSLSVLDLYAETSAFPSTAWADTAHFDAEHKERLGLSVAEMILARTGHQAKSAAERQSAVEAGSTKTGPDGELR